MKRKLSLKDLEVSSFVTSTKELASNIMGGASEAALECIPTPGGDQSHELACSGPDRTVNPKYCYGATVYVTGNPCYLNAC